MTQQEFNILSLKYLEGQTTDSENEFLELWYKQNQEAELVKINETQEKKIERKLWRHIRKAQSPFTFRILLPYLGIAASILVLFIWNLNTKNTNTTYGFLPQKSKDLGIEIKNTTTKPEKIKLEDGTTVLLEKNGIIRYTSAFNKTNREVYLRGSAFFNVKRDETRPFIVHAGDLVTEVLGTSFMIKQYRDNQLVEVEVKSGRVSVYSENSNIRNDKNGVILTPNQMVTFDEKTQNIEQKIVNKPMPLVQIDQVVDKFNFEQVTIQQVLKELSAIYGLEFVITNQKMNNCQITADLNNLEMFTQLDFICKSIGASYEKRGTVIFINGDGCD